MVANVHGCADIDDDDDLQLEYKLSRLDLRREEKSAIRKLPYSLARACVQAGNFYVGLKNGPTFLFHAAEIERGGWVRLRAARQLDSPDTPSYDVSVRLECANWCASIDLEEGQTQ